MTGTSVGGFGTFIDNGLGEANLAALDSGGSVDLYLYYYPTATDGNAGSGLQVAKLTTSADGHVAVTGEPMPETPIPPSILLLGSGLIGLIGIRRKQSA